MDLDRVAALPGFPNNLSVRVCVTSEEKALRGRELTQEVRAKVVATGLEVVHLEMCSAAVAEAMAIGGASGLHDLRDRCVEMSDLGSTETWYKYVADNRPELGERCRMLFGDSDGAALMAPVFPEGMVGAKTVEGLMKANAYVIEGHRAYTKQVEELAAEGAADCEEVELLWIKWSDLFSYGPDNHCDFRSIDGKVAQLSGPNGIGKSAFMDVVCPSITGSTTSMRVAPKQQKKITGDLVNKLRPSGSTLANTTLCFRKGVKPYEIFRQFTTQRILEFTTLKDAKGCKTGEGSVH
jgi:hypothetical protein